ncbi:MAG: hypothetical protein H6662_14555 [Ardenticatenaceae bacterium]|nr:hypothetical protein [Anaerolineales bacterium]MCB8922806.1 hypothetical protein [Ardenticatenaceae bacterium]MCB8991939.1 hypothetical protein [Ardenticatenaceae bacterium]MCB9004749.1 hypothetical protein [Ardenticatenaceae bacterium]
MSEAREALEERVQKAIFQESIFRWESAVVISLTLLLTVLSLTGLPVVSFIPWWIWLIGGLVSEGGLVYSSLSDPKFGEKVAAGLLRHDFEPERLRDKQLQRQIKDALEYRGRIEEAVRGQGDSLLKDELTQTGVQIDEWLEHVYHLAQRIDRYRRDQQIVVRDRTRAEMRLAQLQQELVLETDTAVKETISTTIEGLQKQIDTVERLQNTIQRAELQLENTLTSLRTIYSQTMLVEAKDIDSSRARRLRHEISEEVNELNDVLVAMDEVYTTNVSGE